MGLRAMYMFGAALPAEENVHQGCCGRQFVGGSRGYLAPNRLVEADGRFTAGGLDFELFHTGGEAASEIGLYLPAQRVVLLGDELYPALANLYTIRGAKFRDAQKWATAGRRALEFDVEYLLGTHLPGPIVGREAIASVIETHGDAIQFRRTPPAERGRRLVALMGGRDQVLRKAQQALAGGDAQWCAELTTLVLRGDPEDEDARLLKAAALRALGYAETNPQWRNWYLTGAGGLDGSIDPKDLAETVRDSARGSDLPIPVLLEALRYRGKAVDTGRSMVVS
jgi:alkyl sulfatase BDS1-like metallo-beta-lactamase superfamily hydrolase